MRKTPEDILERKVSKRNAERIIKALNESESLEQLSTQGKEVN